VRIAYEARETLKNVNFIVSVVRSDGVACCNYSTETDGFEIREVEGSGVIELEIPELKLTSERYTLSILVREKGFQSLLCGQVGGVFHIRHELFDTHFGVFHETGQWKWQAAASATPQGVSASS